MVSVPVRVPPAVGLKTTFTVQLAPAAIAPEQVLVWLKSPEVVMLEISSGPFPVFWIVTVVLALEVPTTCPLNERLAGETLAVDTKPVPARLTVEAPPLELLLTVNVPLRLP